MEVIDRELSYSEYLKRFSNMDRKYLHTKEQYDRITVPRPRTTDLDRTRSNRR